MTKLETVFQTIASSPLGFTRDGICEVTGFEVSTVNPRVLELLAEGRIIETTQRRKTRSGRDAKVLIVPETRASTPSPIRDSDLAFA